MLVSAGSWDRSQRTRTPSKRAYGYDPKELLASKPSSGAKQASAGSSECADAAQSASVGRTGAAAAGQARQAAALQDAELDGRTAQQQQQQQQPSQHAAAAPDVTDRGLSAQQPFQQAPAMPPLPKLAIWQLEPPAQPVRPPGGMRSVWQCPKAARKPRTGVRTLEVPVHVGFSIQGLSAALHRTKVHWVPNGDTKPYALASYNCRSLPEVPSTDLARRVKVCMLQLCSGKGW
jgi:hypothetical protein